MQPREARRCRAQDLRSRGRGGHACKGYVVSTGGCSVFAFDRLRVRREITENELSYIMFSLLHAVVLHASRAALLHTRVTFTCLCTHLVCSQYHQVK